MIRKIIFGVSCILGIEGLGGKADVKVSTDIYVQRNCVSFKKEGGKSRKKKSRVGGKGWQTAGVSNESSKRGRSLISYELRLIK